MAIFFVTGAAGFIGSNLVDRLLQADTAWWLMMFTDDARKQGFSCRQGVH